MKIQPSDEQLKEWIHGWYYDSGKTEQYFARVIIPWALEQAALLVDDLNTTEYDDRNGHAAKAIRSAIPFPSEKV